MLTVAIVRYGFIDFVQLSFDFVGRYATVSIVRVLRVMTLFTLNAE